MELRPYQKRIANWLCDHPHACLSVGMGLGKTAAVLHFLDYTRRLYPAATTLIVAPKRVAETVWMQEAEKWELSKLLANMQLVTAKNKEDADSTAPVKIVSRDNVGLFAGKHFPLPPFGVFLFGYFALLIFGSLLFIFRLILGNIPHHCATTAA